MCLYYSGIYFLSRTIRKARRSRRIVILAYHSFSDSMRYLDMAIPPKLFIDQVRFLRKTFIVQTLSKLLATDDTTRVSGDVAVITADDGYADNYQPLLEAAETFGAPSTVFLTTDSIDRGQPTSVMWVTLAVHHATVNSIDLPGIGPGPIRTKKPTEKESAIREIDRALKALSPNQRSAIIDRLLERSGAEALVRQLGRCAMLQWQQIQRMHSSGVEFGAHTCTHPVLSLLDPAAVIEEIDRSIQRVKEMTGAKSIAFAYPYGSHAEVDETVVELCRGSGATAAVMLVEGEMPGSDLFRIPRLMVTSDRCTTPWGSFCTAVWACELEGLVDVVRNVVAFIKRR